MSQGTLCTTLFLAVAFSRDAAKKMELPHALATLPMQQEPPFPLEQVSGWDPEPVWMFWRWIFCPTGIQTPTCPACNLVTILAPSPIKCTCVMTNDFVLVFLGVPTHLFYVKGYS